MNETMPSLAKAVPSQPIDAPSEENEGRPETESNLPAEPQTKIETNLPVQEQPVYSQPAAALSEQGELPQKTDLRQAEVRPQPVQEDAIASTEERIIHREEWLLSQAPFYYTIQLMGVRKEALLFDFVKRNQLLEQNEISFYQTTFKDKPWFQLLYGVYATKKDAQSAADNLPPEIRKSSPWIRRMSAVQKAIRIRAAQ
jgi:septal ring-binding cell division protein DamX